MVILTRPRQNLDQGLNGGKLLTLTLHVSVNIETRYMIGRNRLNPHALPDSTARCVENVTGVKSLLSNGNNIVRIIGGIMDKYKSIRM